MKILYTKMYRSFLRISRRIFIYTRLQDKFSSFHFSGSVQNFPSGKMIEGNIRKNSNVPASKKEHYITLNKYPYLKVQSLE